MQRRQPAPSVSLPAPAPRPASGIRIRPHEAQHETRIEQAGIDAFVSRVDELRRLYCEGEIDAALDLAASVRPATLGFSLRAVPVLALAPGQLGLLPLDARVASVLSLIDGQRDLAALLDATGHTEEEAVALVESLIGAGAVRLLPPDDNA